MNYFSIYSLSRGISQHICCRGLFLLSMHCAPLFRKKQEGFLLWWGIFQKSSTLITFPSVAIGMEKRQSIDPQSTGDQNEVGIGNFTHIFHKSDDAENQRGVSSSSPPSVKINKITIKKIPCCDKSRLSHRLFRKAQEERGSQLYQKWELIFDWIYGGKNCFKGGRVEICLYKNEDQRNCM